MRWIMHIDMDAFFASVEQLDNPELKGKPLIVGGQSCRGVVSTCSYEARKFGVHSAMPMVEARRLCPHAEFLPGRMWRYEEVSREIMRIFHEEAPLVEQLSIDEAFLDVSGMERLCKDVRNVGWRIKERIKNEIGLTCSVGLAPNKFLAKMASDLQKPDGFTVITHEKARSFIASLPVTKIFGIGGAAKQMLPSDSLPMRIEAFCKKSLVKMRIRFSIWQWVWTIDLLFPKLLPSPLAGRLLLKKIYTLLKIARRQF